jgi:hypothetical protein
MKGLHIFSLLIVFMLISVAACKNRTDVKQLPVAGQDVTNENNLIPVGREIVTEVYTRPDTLGDPWEVEKVSGYDGREMFSHILDGVYSGSLTAYDCITGEELSKDAIGKIKKQVGTESENIGKIIFTEDWFWDPASDKFIKKIKSLSFGYETKRETGLPPAYTPLFQIIY